jgi:non-specific serine/threonine protein kinase
MGKRTGAPHQQTLLAAVTWSHGLLDQEQKILFRRLSVFSGGFDLDAAEAVGAGTPVEFADVVGLLTGLVEKSLVVADAGTTGRARYRFLETLREFALARLVESGEDGDVRRRHALQYRALAEDSEHKFRGPDAGTWLARHDEDHDNARSAMVWALDSDPEVAFCLATEWSWYRLQRGHLTEARQSLDIALRHSDRVEINSHIDALRAAATLAQYQGDDPEADRMFKEAANLLGNEMSERSATILIGLGNVAKDRRDFERANEYFGRAVSVARQCGALHRQAAALGNLGNCALEGDQQDLVKARDYFEKAVAIFEQVGDAKAAALGYVNLSSIEIEDGRHDAASSLLRSALDVYTRLADPRLTADAISNFSALAAGRGQPERALILGGASVALAEALGTPPGPWWKLQLVNYWHRMRGLLDPVDAEAAWEKGRRMTIEDAVTLALSDHDRLPKELAR